MRREGHRVSWMGRVATYPFLWAIWAYRATLSPFIGGQCRFEPTCSRYALGAYKTFGPIKGTRLTAWRLLRCQPFTKGGYDPVPLPPGQGGCGVGRVIEGAEEPDA